MLSVLINTHLLMAHATREWRAISTPHPRVSTRAKQAVPAYRGSPKPTPIPMPEDGYDWEKLFSERSTGIFSRTSVSNPCRRYHNVYGPHGTYDGGREKAPAAICRKSFGQS